MRWSRAASISSSGLRNGGTLRTHFRMDGSWHIYRPGTPWKGGPAFEVRAVLATDEWECVGYRLHDVELVPTAEEGRLVGHLGPDVLGPDWDLDEALRRFSSAPDEQIGVALVDQRNLAGIGNLYKVESLFLLGAASLDPGRRRSRPGRARGQGADLDAREPAPPRADDDRQPAPRPRPLGVRPPREALPAVRHGDPARRTGTTAAGAGDLVVPELPGRPVPHRPAGPHRRARSPPAGHAPLSRCGQPGRRGSDHHLRLHPRRWVTAAAGRPPIPQTRLIQEAGKLLRLPQVRRPGDRDTAVRSLRARDVTVAAVCA